MTKPTGRPREGAPSVNAFFRTLPGADDWERRARCRGEDPDLFFPEQGGTGVPAKRLCRVCPVAAECLEAAMESPGLVGIWGGTNRRERERIRAKRAAAAARPI